MTRPINKNTESPISIWVGGFGIFGVDEKDAVIGPGIKLGCISDNWSLLGNIVEYSRGNYGYYLTASIGS